MDNNLPPSEKSPNCAPDNNHFFAPRCAPHRNCAADNNPARRKLCGGFQRRLPGIVCRITTCIKEAARQTVPPITIQPVENCAADSNPRCPAPAENVRRITPPPKKTPPVLEQTAQFEVKILFFFLKGVCYNKRVKSSGCKARQVLCAVLWYDTTKKEETKMTTFRKMRRGKRIKES